MAGLFNFTSSKFKLYAVVWINQNGQPAPYILDVTSTVVSYALNSVPQAQLNVAVGCEATTGLPANVHYLVDVLKMQLPIQLYLTAFEAANSYGINVETWPNGPFLIFEGYLTGSGYDKSRNDISYSFSAQHWLIDLTFSSALTRLTGSLNAAQLSTAGAYLPGDGVFPSFLANTLALQYFTTTNITLDFWGKSLLPWLLQICSQDMLVDPDDPILNNNQGRTNYEAGRALNRFEPNPNYVFGVPLQMDPLLLPESNAVASALSDAITAETYDTLASQSLWSKLAGGYAGDFSFAIVPMVQSALVVPLTPGLQTVWQTIWAEEYDSISLHGFLPRVLRGVRLFGGMGSQTGAFGFQTGVAGVAQTIGGRYDNPNLTDGMLQYGDLPRWLANISPPARFGGQAANPGGIIGNAFFPGAGPVPNVLAPPAIRQQGTSLFNDLAEAFYVNEAIKDRQGTVQGKLRFDIAPGSSVQVMLNEERFVEARLGAAVGANSLFGTVMALTHVLDAEGMHAGTTFNIGWLRSPLENQLAGTSLARHPFWTQTWAGAPNVDRVEFLPRGNVLNFGS